MRMPAILSTTPRIAQRVKQQLAQFRLHPLLYASYLAQQPYFQFVQRRRMLALRGKTNRVIVLLVPGFDSVSGGVLSIHAFYAATQKVLGPQATVLVGTYPNKLTLLRYRMFYNEAQLIQFNLILDSIGENQTLCLHMPEYYAALFLQDLTPQQQSKLRAIKELHINIMNQNIQLMPPPETVNQLRQLTANITMTTAHSSYTTPALRQRYAMPTHLLTAWFEQQETEKIPYGGKENIMIVSPDVHPDKEEILAVIRQAFPSLKLIIIQNMKYDDYKLLEAKAKWSISFGEGFDGYTVFPVLKGGVTFSVYNDDFFMPKYQVLPTFYASYDVLRARIVADMQRLDNPAAYETYNNEMYALCHQDYSYEKYLHRVKDFYQGHYTLP